MLRTRQLKTWLLAFGISFSTISITADEFTLHLNGEEEYAITEIITAMGEKNLARLFLDSSRLTSLGDSIQHVPPLQFIGFVLSDKYLTDCLRVIHKSYFKWSTFIDGLSSNMNHELDCGRLLLELDDFANIVGADAEVLKGLSRERQWENFVKVLL